MKLILRKLLVHHKRDWDAEILGSFGGVERKISESQIKLKEAARLLDKGTVEYNQLYSSRLKLLVQVAALLIRCEDMGQLKIARALENILEDEGVERFEPMVGDPIPRSKCKVSKIEFNGISPGLIALVSAPGFLNTDGEVILPADVFESVLPIESEVNRITVRPISGETEAGLENFFDVLLLCSGE